MAATVDRGKKSHNQKVESYLLFGDFPEYYSLRDSLSDSSEELFQTGKGGARIHTSFGWKKRNPTHQTSQWLMVGNIHCLLGWGVFVCAVRSSSLRPHGLSLPACFVHGISRQEHWSGLPFPSPGDLPNSGIKPVSLVSSALAGRFFATNATWEAGNVFFFVHMLWFEPQYPLPGIPTSFPTTFFWGKKLWHYLCIQLCGIFECIDFSSCSEHRGDISFSPGNVGLSRTTAEMTSLVLCEMLTVVLDLLNFPWKVHILVANVLMSQCISPITVLTE